MTERRSFLACAVGMLASVPMFGQKAIMENGQAVICKEDSSIKCPLRHATCKRVNAPLVVGNGNREYPDMAQLYELPVYACDICGMLFTVKA